MEQKGFVTIASYNMSFACGQGKKIGSEKKFIHDSLKRIKKDDPKELFKNSCKHLLKFINEKNPDLIGIQEINDQNFNTESLGTTYITDLLNNNEKYSFSIYGKEYDKIKPTIMMIWNSEKLGKEKESFGGELGTGKYDEQNQKGRPIQMVITDKNFVLINLHGPNSKIESFENEMKILTETINNFIGNKLKNIDNFSKVFFVGDFNDPYGYYGAMGLELDKFPSIKFRSRTTPLQNEIKSCCYNFDSADTSHMQKYNGQEYSTGRPGEFNETKYTLYDEQQDSIRINNLCDSYDNKILNGNIKPNNTNFIYNPSPNECKNFFSFGSDYKRGMISTYLFEGDYCLGFCVRKNLDIWGRDDRNVFSNESDHELVWAQFWYFNINQNL